MRIYLTPASISYLTQFILSLAITAFLALRLRHRTRQSRWLVRFFAMATLFIGLMALDASLPPYPRLFAVYAQNTVLALGVVCLLRFAYHFPQRFPHRQAEASAALVVSLAYALVEAGYMGHRYISLLGRGVVLYRPLAFDYANAVVLLWVPLALLRQCIAADPRPVGGVRKLWDPQGQGARGARAFVLVFGIPFLLGVINVVRAYVLISTATYNIALSIGILTALWLFATSYVNFIPGGVSVLTKLSILTLTFFLALLGSISWIIAPPYIRAYRPDLVDYQTFRFMPNASGGYDVALAEFAFETDLGDRLVVHTTDETRNQRVDFTFPFYDQTYTEIYVTSSGAISMGEPFWQPNMQARYLNVPTLFPLMVDLDPDVGGGVYARVAEDCLILTWDRVPSQYRPETRFTFQAILYRDGGFDITYNGLPLPIPFAPDESPSASPWVRGATPGRGASLHTGETRLSDPIPRGRLAVIENYQMDFRRYVHPYIVPLAWVVIGGSVMLVVVLPLLLHYAVVRPLNALLAGVRQMEAGDLDVEVAVQSHDEIGFLTLAFNKMAARLDDLVTGLEARVAERTSALAAQNAELDAFAHTVAHDLKGPIGVIIGFASVLVTERERLTPEDVTASTGHILRTAEKLDQITDELMLLTGVRKEEVMLGPLDMGRIVEESLARLEVLSQEARAQITVRDAAAWPTAWGYASWVEEVWVNYISNAIKYGGRPPVLELGAECWTDPSPDGSAMVRFWVRDNGPGLSAESQRELFTPFTRLEQVRAKGHGLGLSIVRRIVEKLGGEVGVESEPGHGSTFYFTLPAAPRRPN